MLFHIITATVEISAYYDSKHIRMDVTNWRRNNNPLTKSESNCTVHYIKDRKGSKDDKEDDKEKISGLRTAIDV